MNIVEKLLRRPTNGQPIAGGFTPEAKAGLKEIGYKFIWVVQAESLDHLIANGVISEECVISSSSLRAFVPVAREVAVDPNHLVLPNSCNLSLDDMLEETAKYAQRLRKINLKHGSLETVDFNLTNASVYVQLDQAHQQTKKHLLYYAERCLDALVIRTIDEIDKPGHTAAVGRRNYHFLGVERGQLNILGWPRDTKPSQRPSIYGCLHPGIEDIWAAPVAQPKQITQIPPIFYT